MPTTVPSETHFVYAKQTGRFAKFCCDVKRLVCCSVFKEIVSQDLGLFFISLNRYEVLNRAG
jgi:hypothetical protein